VVAVEVGVGDNVYVLGVDAVPPHFFYQGGQELR